MSLLALQKPVSSVWVSLTDTRGSDAAELEQLRSYFQGSRGWPDAPWNFAITANGQVLTVRGWGSAPGVFPARKQNIDVFAVAVLGREYTPSSVVALASVLRDAYDRAVLAPTTTIEGLSDDALDALVDEIWNPTPPPPPEPEPVPEPLTVEERLAALEARVAELENV